MAERGVNTGVGVDVELVVLVPSCKAGGIGVSCNGEFGKGVHQGKSGDELTMHRKRLTLSPESTTRRFSSRGLYCEDFGQCKIRLHFRLRCSLRRALERVSLMASAVPKMADIPTRTEIMEAMSGC